MIDNENAMQEFDEPSLSSASRLAAFPPRRWHLVLAGACIVVVYLAGVTGRWWPTPDSALYLGLGRSLAAGEGYRFNGSAHNIVTPGLPLILAALQKLFGPGFWAPNLFIALCGLITILLVYLVAAQLSDRRMALAVALATAFSYTFFNHSHRILTDAPFAALFWALLFAYLRYRRRSAWWLIPVGLLSAAGIVMRAPGILILISLAIGALLDRSPGGIDTAQNRPVRKRLFSAGVILIAPLAVGGGFCLLALAEGKGAPIYVRNFLLRVSIGMKDNLHDFGLGLTRLPFVMSEMLTSQENLILALLIGLPALLVAGIGAVSLWRRKRRLVLPLIVISVLALATCGREAVGKSRYLLSIQPLLLLTLMEGLCWSVKRFRRPARPIWLLRAVTIFTALIIACNAPRLMRNAVYYSYLSYTSRYYEVIREGRFAEFFPIAEILRQGPPLQSPAAVDGGGVSILHLLSNRLTAPLPDTRGEETLNGKAKVIHDYAAEHREIGFVVVNVKDITNEFIKQQAASGNPVNEKAESAAEKEFIQHLKSYLMNKAGMSLPYEGERYHVYQRPKNSLTFSAT